jgi:hypothetical protein
VVLTRGNLFLYSSQKSVSWSVTYGQRQSVLFMEAQAMPEAQDVAGTPVAPGSAGSALGGTGG